MKTIDRYFQKFTGGLDDGAVHDLAKAWIYDLNNWPPDRDSADKDDDNVGTEVVAMNLIAPTDTQWRFILKVLELSNSDKVLCHLAAGPMEHLMGNHGPTYIDLVEDLAATDGKFARMITGCWRHRMSDDVWARIQTIQTVTENPIK